MSQCGSCACAAVRGLSVPACEVCICAAMLGLRMCRSVGATCAAVWGLPVPQCATERPTRVRLLQAINEHEVNEALRDSSN